MKEISIPLTDSDRSALLADPGLREALERFVRAKVPTSEVEDVVQSTLTDAIASTRAPETAEELRRWIYGIARHKVADHHRRAARERAPDSRGLDDVPAESVPHDARELLRWAERELPQGEQAQDTLEWMLREGDGEKLEHIAEEHEVGAPRVRQRVSRMRRFFRERWAQQLAAVAAVVLLVLAGVWIWASGVETQPRIVRDVPSAIPPLEQRVVEMRERALEDCRSERWRRCLEQLDEARRLDPAGERRSEILEARKRAEDALKPKPDAAALDASAPPRPSSLAPTPPRTSEVPKAPMKLPSSMDPSK